MRNHLRCLHTIGRSHLSELEAHHRKTVAWYNRAKLVIQPTPQEETTRSMMQSEARPLQPFIGGNVCKDENNTRCSYPKTVQITPSVLSTCMTPFRIPSVEELPVHTQGSM